MTFNQYIISPKSSILAVLKKLRELGRKSLLVSSSDNRLLGIVSDGDIRNSLLKGAKLESTIDKIFNKNPVIVNKKTSINLLLVKSIFINNRFDILPVIENKKIINCLLWEDIFKKENNKLPNFVDCIIMAGGKGTRLKPFTDILPKPLIPIDGKPVIMHILEKCQNFGFKKIYLSLNDKSNIIKSYLSEYKKKNNLDYILEKFPLGTIGSLGLIKKKIKNNFFVFNCDMIFNLNFKNLYDHHVKNKYDITITASLKKYTIPYGVCEIDGNNLLKKINEKPELDLFINLGLYVFSKKIINLIPANKPLDANQLIEKVIKLKLKVGVYPVDEESYADVGQWSEYKKIISR
jgi:dTDP-glucose pyrophosphorylase